MNSDMIEEIEMNIKEAQKIVGIGESLTRLTNNRDFKKVILDGFLKDEAVRLTHLKGAPQTQSSELQASIVKELDGIGTLLNYFRKTEHMANQAQAAIDDDRESIAELESEGDAG